MLPIDSCYAFIDALDQLKQEPAHSYLIQSKGRWHYISQKSEKEHFSTQAFVKLAEDCLETFSHWHGTAELPTYTQKLKEGLQVYSKRLYASKTWYWKILSHLGIKHPVEYKIALLTYRFTHLQKQKAYEQKIVQHLRTCCNRPFLLLTGAYHKLFGMNFKRIGSLDGLPAHLNHSVLAQDLEKFVATLDKGSQDYVILSQALNELALAEIINYSIHTEQYSSAHALIKDAMQSLGKPHCPYHSILVPGGWKKHGIAFQIMKESNKTYSLRIIDSNDGYIEKDGKYFSIFDYLIEQVKEQKIRSELIEDWIKGWINSENYKQKRVDLVLKNLSETAFGFAFFRPLFKHHKEQSSKEETLKFIKAKLLKPNDCNLAYSQREHRTQQKGTCAMKCLTLWLRDRLGDSLHLRFKAFLADEQLQALDQLAGQNLSIADLNLKKSDQELLENDIKEISLAGLLQEMQKAGREVREKRHRKVALLNTGPLNDTNSPS